MSSLDEELTRERRLAAVEGSADAVQSSAGETAAEQVAESGHAAQNTHGI